MVHVAGVLLAFGLLGSLWLLIQDARRRALSERMTLLARADRGAGGAELPSIRTHRRELSRAFRMVARALRLRPDVQEVNLLPWPLVLLAGAAVGAAAFVGLQVIASMRIAVPAAVAAALFAARGIFQWEADRFSMALFGQLPDALELLVSAVSAGLPVTAAFRQIAAEMPSPTREQFGKVVAEIAVGRPADAALVEVFERSGVVEYAILAMTIGLQTQGGGRISESAENLGRIIRERVTVAQRAHARAAEARLGGWVLSGLPVVFALASSAVNPNYLRVFTADPSATRLLGIGVILLIFGIVSMRSIIRWSLSE